MYTNKNDGKGGRQPQYDRVGKGRDVHLNICLEAERSGLEMMAGDKDKEGCHGVTLPQDGEIRATRTFSNLH